MITRLSLCMTWIVLQLSICLAASADEYDVYLLAGQSNMDGRGQASDLTEEQRAPLDNVIIYYRNSILSSEGWKPLAPGFSVPPKFNGPLPAPTFGPEIGFAISMLQARPERKIAIIKGSKGGTSLKVDWYPGTSEDKSSQGPRYRDFVETIDLSLEELRNQGHKYQLRGLLWHQGESDSKSSTEDYKHRLEQFITRLREEIGHATLPVVVGEVYDNGKRDSVRKATQIVAKESKTVGLVTCEGTKTWDPGTHFDAPSQLLLGRRYATEMCKLLDSHVK